MVTQISISKSSDNKINVSLPYNPAHIAKLKSIKGYRWHPEEKYWSFPDSNGTLKKILKVFDGEEIHVDSALQTKLSSKNIPGQGVSPTDKQGFLTPSSTPIKSLRDRFLFAIHLLQF